MTPVKKKEINLAPCSMCTEKEKMGSKWSQKT